MTITMAVGISKCIKIVLGLMIAWGRLGNHVDSIEYLDADNSYL